jgi:putative effector of murein hydrolase
MIWVLLTLVVFFLCRFVSQKLNHPLANPLMLSVGIIIPVLIIFDIPYETYNEHNHWFTYLLQPAVVALAYPLYEQFPEIKKNWRIILLACGVGSILSMVTASIIALTLKADISLIAALLG